MSCYLVKQTTVAVTYVYPAIGNRSDEFAQRFIDTYKQLSGDYPHELYVVANGTFPKGKVEKMFSGVPIHLIQHDNSGWDIGAYQLASRTVPCDLMVFLGNSTYIKRKGWINRMVESFEKYGPALYGCMGHTGAPGVSPHIRTTGFWIPPRVFNLYPSTINIPQQRYAFEHGPDCLTSWIISIPLPVFVVTANGEYGMDKWNQVPNGYHQGDQSNLLVGDRLTAPPYYGNP